MQPAGEAARSPWTWLLAVVLFVAACVLLPRTPLFWLPAETATRLDAAVGLQAGRQSMEAASKLLRPRRPADHRVAVLGNSRIWFGAPEWILERELRAQRPDLDVRVDGLAIFGTRIGDLEMISRHLGRADPEVVVLAIGGSELVEGAWAKLVNKMGEFFDTGWADGPIPPATRRARLRRWINTALPLIRMRRFARHSLEDRLSLGPEARPVPARFASTEEIFSFFYGPPAPEILESHRRWLRTRSYEDFLAYLETGNRLRGEELFDPESLSTASPGARALDTMLARFHADGRRTVVLLMPDNPLLAFDTEGRFHRPGFRDLAAGVIREVAARHDARVVDAEHWLAAEDFLDFFHPMPDVGGLQRPLAKEILRELDS